MAAVFELQSPLLMSRRSSCDTLSLSQKLCGFTPQFTYFDQRARLDGPQLPWAPQWYREAPALKYILVSGFTGRPVQVLQIILHRLVDMSSDR